ncbi:MAG: hypothetical protein HUU46_12210 [Candidatus Hydrogenedentes bacterium]|nr:hypothetical protein [Candidatus Hydrogenedentota bacterium]
MKKIGKFALIALVIVVLAVGISVYVANSRYEFLFAGPRVSHETRLTQGVRVRAVAKPPLARPLVSKMLGAGAPSPWILDRVIPYEAALLASPDIVGGRMDVVLFLNPQRLAPVIAPAIDAYAIPKKIGYVTWASDMFDVSTRGVLSLDGFMSIDAATIDAVKAEWGLVTLPSLPPFEGTHLGEVSIDNRDGSLYTLLSTFANQQLLTLPMPLDSLRKTIAPVATMSLTADLAGDDELAIKLLIECQPTAEPGQVTGVSFAIAGIFGELQKYAAQKGANLSGEKRTEGQTIIGNYTLTNVSALVAL